MLIGQRAWEKGASISSKAVDGRSSEHISQVLQGEREGVIKVSPLEKLILH